MKVIRQYLLQDSELLNLLNGEHIYLVEKPEKIKCSSYIIYNYKPINSGIIKDYQITFNLVGKDLSTLIQLQKRLMHLLDEVREAIRIKDTDTTIKLTEMLNGGGILKNPDTDMFEIVIYFLVKI